MFASVPSAMLRGARGQAVQVEVHLGKGLPGLHIVGLPDESIREARDRARAALASSGHDWPNHLITISLRPATAGRRAPGSTSRSPLACSIVAGDHRRVPDRGLGLHRRTGPRRLGTAGARIVPIVAAIEGNDVVVPASTVVEASIAARGDVHPVRTLLELLGTLCDGEPWPDHEPACRRASPASGSRSLRGPGPTARPAGPRDRRGRRSPHAVHGPAGFGQDDARIPPAGHPAAPRPDQALEATMVHSAAGAPLPPSGLIERPPFRAPHHTSSQVAIIGGGSQVARPGEVSLAHHGVLFLDEIAEFPACGPRFAAPTTRGRRRACRTVHSSATPCRRASCSSPR